MNEVKICVFADLHDADGYYNNAPERLEKILQHAREEQVDLVLHCGDLCHGPTLKPELMQQCDAFPLPLLHSIGNHECDGSTYEQVLAAYHMPKGYYYRDVHGYRFIAFDADQMLHHGKLIHYEMKNYWHIPDGGLRDETTVMDVLGDEQIAWLEQTIMDSPFPCVLFGHHSFVRLKDALRPEEREKVQAMMRRVNADKQRVQLVMCGHYHVDYLNIVDNVPYFEVNSASNYYIGPTHDRYPAEILEQHPNARHTLIHNDPVHAIVTLREDGTVHIRGMKSSYFCGVTMESLGLPLGDPDGRLITPDVLTASFKLNMRGLDHL